jgi:hypothetical protein
MGMLVRFPEGRVAKSAKLLVGKPESATVIILPVIRIERYSEEPPAPTPSGRRRRRAIRT